MRAPVLIILYLGVVLSPLALSWAQGLTPRSVWDELSTGLGLLALSMILVEFVLLGRFRSVTDHVGSDVIMRSHQLLARAALVLALLHPFFYISPRQAPPVWDITRQTVVDYSWVSLWPGIVAWLLLGGLVVMAIAKDAAGLRYETWRLLHGLGAALIAGFGVLHALRAGRYSADPSMELLWLVLLGLALAALAYVYVLAPLKRQLRPWRVADIRHEGDRTWILTLTPDFKGRFSYKAGQFAWLNIGRSVFSLNENPFSFSSAPSQGPDVEFMIKELGDSTRRIGSVKPGTRAWLEAPHGHLTAEGQDDAKGIALIAGGVGLAPLIGVLRELRSTGDTRPISLIYGNRHKGQIAFKEELDSYARDKGTELIYVLYQPRTDWAGERGYITAELLRKYYDTPERRDWLYIICGPPVMLEIAEETLISIGIPSHRIRSEQFVYD